MKPKSTRLFPSALVVVIATAATTALSFAASGSWTDPASGDWSTGPWTGGVPDAASDIATFTQDWTGQVINVDGTFTVGSILASDTAAGGGGLTISGGSLILDDGANTPVIQTDAGFTESNGLKLSSTLAGSSGFEKTGAGYLALTGSTNTFTGTIKLTGTTGGSFTVLSSDANLGDAANTLEVAVSGSATGLYNAASAGAFTLNSARTITTSGSGAFWVKNKSGANMTIAGVISGTAQLRKNDSGTLTLTGANTFTGGTLLDGGTLVLSGGDNRLASDRAVTFNSVSTLNLTNTSQTVTRLGVLGTGVTNTVTGVGGTLIINETADVTWNTTATGTTVDMSGLSNFTLNRTAGSFQLNANGLNVVNTINLAKAGTNTINVTNARFGGGANFAGQNVLVGLGQSNNINASGEFVIGFFQGNGNVSFQSGLTAPALTVRGAAGTGPTPLMTVGSTNSGNQSSTGILNLTGGSLDVIATDFYVARHFANAGGTLSTGTVTMPAGTVVADTLSLAAKTGATTGAPTLTGTFTQSGGSVTATTVNLGLNTNAEAPTLIANYNLFGGTLTATTIQRSAATSGVNSVRNLVLRGGTLQNKTGADLTIAGVTAVVAGTTTTVVSPTAGQKVVFGSTATYSARFNSFTGTSGALTVTGALDLTGSPGFFVFDDAPTTATALPPATKLVLIDYSGGSLSGEFAGLAEGDTVSVTKGAVTNDFVLSYSDSNRVTLTIPTGGGDYGTWATDNGIPGQPFTEDFDNDGLDNGVEYGLGLDPTVSSVPAGVVSNGGLTTTYIKGADAKANGDVTFKIETSTDLGATIPWAVNTTLVTETADDISITFTPGAPDRNFARLRVVQVP